MRRRYKHFLSDKYYLSAELRKRGAARNYGITFLSPLLHNAIIVCATSCSTPRCFVSIPLIHDRFYARSRRTAYNRCSPLVVHIVISDRDEPSLGPNGWSPRLRVCRRFIARARRLGARASYRLSQRDVTRPTMETAVTR